MLKGIISKGYNNKPNEAIECQVVAENEMDIVEAKGALSDAISKMNRRRVKKGLKRLDYKIAIKSASGVAHKEENYTKDSSTASISS